MELDLTSFKMETPELVRSFSGRVSTHPTDYWRLAMSGYLLSLFFLVSVKGKLVLR